MNRTRGRTVPPWRLQGRPSRASRRGRTPSWRRSLPWCGASSPHGCRDSATADDLVQETLVRVLAASGGSSRGCWSPTRSSRRATWSPRCGGSGTGTGATSTASSISLPAGSPDEDLLAREEQSAIAQALVRLSDRERETLLAHEVSGQDTRSLAAELGSTAGAVAAQLNRARARLRVEYLLARDRIEPPTDRCRPVLLALSGGDRRRQREVDAAPSSPRVRPLRAAQPAAAGARTAARDDQIASPSASDGDIVARPPGRP